MDSQDILRRPHAATPPSRHDVAHLGRVRKVVDWRGRDAVSFRYDRATGKPVRVTDRLGNHRILEYDGTGNCVRLSRRAGWTVSTEPVRSFSYDRAGRLASVSELGADGAAVRTVAVSRYALGRVVGEEHADGSAVSYAYDAAGRLVREGGRAYRYGYLDKVLSVTEGKRKLTYTYHADGQLATADLGDGRAERFAWDGLALIRRGDEGFVNEPHVGGGNPVVSSKGTAYLNDMLGTTVCVREGRASSRPKPRGKCTAAALTAFGEPLPGAGGGAFFTGKPQVEGLGYAFLYRNYRPDLAKWQTADPFGYPDGWNRLAYGVNSPLEGVDLLGAAWGNREMVAYYFRYAPETVIASVMLPWLGSVWWNVRRLTSDDYIDTDVMGLTDRIFGAVKNYAYKSVGEFVAKRLNGDSGSRWRKNFDFGVDCEHIVFALGWGSGRLLGKLNWSWRTTYEKAGDVMGVPYAYGHTWSVNLNGKGVIPRVVE